MSNTTGIFDACRFSLAVESYNFEFYGRFAVIGKGQIMKYILVSVAF
jgi:predicted methyltransferase